MPVKYRGNGWSNRKTRSECASAIKQLYQKNLIAELFRTKIWLEMRERKKKQWELLEKWIKLKLLGDDFQSKKWFLFYSFVQWCEKPMESYQHNEWAHSELPLCIIALGSITSKLFGANVNIVWQLLQKIDRLCPNRPSYQGHCKISPSALLTNVQTSTY